MRTPVVFELGSGPSGDGGGLRAVVGLWFGLLLAAGLGAAPLKVATYNVENYGPADRMTAEGFRKAYPKPEPEKQALREVIRGLKADVLVLQEMGGAPYLEELRRDLKSEGLDYPHAALATASDADRHLAILSRHPLKAVTTHVDLEFTYFGARETVKRGLLEATVVAPEGELTLFALHLKSRFTERKDDPLSALRRAGEAVAIRDRVLRRFPDPASARFLLLGDCNESRSGRPVAALLRRGKTEIASLLPAADSRGESWTHHYRRDDAYTRVDMIFASDGLKPFVRGGTAHIYDGPATRQASDHRPVFAVIEVTGSAAPARPSHD